MRREPVLVVATIGAAISAIIVPPDWGYIKYIDFKTLLCLFCLMVSLKGIEREGVLSALSVKLASGMKSLRALLFLLVFICFFASMFITNDIALIAFVPITLSVFALCGLTKYSAIAIILQTLAANIGSSLTPIGNPQNLYLFMHYHITAQSFLLTTLPFVLFGGTLLAIACLLVPNQPICQKHSPSRIIYKKPIIAYSTMFIIAVTTVFGLIPYWAAAVIIAGATFLIDKHTLKKVDYTLLLTFIVIFIFVGNIARIEWIHGIISYGVQINPMLTAIAASQFISNVPAAVMLSEFTNNATQLLIGVNVGGLGTLIASMASVISYRLYTTTNKKETRHYLGLFTTVNIIFLILTIIFIKTLL
ncbi:MAG: citrate transporter [Nitrososphaerota archaeon]|nr:citrate transporter [Nitrososphaerota archaeon]